MAIPGLSTRPAWIAQEGADNTTDMLGYQDGNGNFAPGMVGIDPADGSEYALAKQATSGAGADHSNNAPAQLAVLKTITVTHAGQYHVQNQSADILQAIFDDGSTGPTIYLLSSGGQGQAGGSAPPLPLVYRPHSDCRAGRLAIRCPQQLSERNSL